MCVGEQGVKKVEKRVYGEACEDFCVPKCSLFGSLLKLGGQKHDDGACPAEGTCADGSCTDCEHHVRTRKYLVVKIKHEEEIVNKCHVEYRLEEPKCKVACPEGTCLPLAPPMPPVEKLAPPKEK